MAKMVSLRLDEGLLEWADAYAKERGVSRSDLLSEGLRSFREDCLSGVPELRKAAKVVIEPNGSGVCPKSDSGHRWSNDSRRSCRHCGRPGRDNVGEEGGFFAEATMARAELFSGLRFPMSSNGAAVKR